MANTHVMRIVALAMMFAFVGCGEPVVEITHKYQADLPVPPNTKYVSVGQFSAEIKPELMPEGELAADAADSLAITLLTTDTFAVQSATSRPATADLYITGKISVTVKDDNGTRKVRIASSVPPLKEVPTLVRNVEVRIVFQLTALPGGKSIGTVETVQKYSSMQDPGTRGENGLLRPDDPSNVPPVGDIVKRLIPGCARTLVSMIQTVDETTRVTLRPASDYMSREALSLVRQKKYAEALTPARVAVGMDNSDAAIFNLAVLCEATGNYDDALQYYGDAAAMSNHSNMQA
ncbi:MAG: tetratricopeptide repeat protein, partial [Planctomycetaceae bacterium]